MVSYSHVSFSRSNTRFYGSFITAMAPICIFCIIIHVKLRTHTRVIVFFRQQRDTQQGLQAT